MAAKKRKLEEGMISACGGQKIPDLVKPPKNPGKKKTPANKQAEKPKK